MKLIILFILNVFFIINSAIADIKLTVAVASNFASTFDKISKLYQKQNEHISFLVSSGASGIFTTQIREGAPYDIFFSANDFYIKELTEKNKIIPTSITNFAIGKLVLWAPNKKINYFNENEIKNLISNPNDKLVIANSELAPFGKAAEEFLENIYKNDENKPKKHIRPNSIEAATNYLKTGSVTFGFVSLSNIIEVADKSEYWIVPQTHYNVINQQAAVIHDSKNKDEALRFLKFIETNKDVKKIIEDAGYSNIPNKS